MAFLPFFDQVKIKSKKQINKILSLQLFNHNKSSSSTMYSLRSKLSSTFKYMNISKLNLIRTQVGYTLIFPYRLNSKTTRNFGIFFKERSYYQVSLIKQNKCLYVNLINISYSFKETTFYIESTLKENVFAKIAHEIKTPLIIIMNLITKILNNIKKGLLSEALVVCNYSSSFSIYLNRLINDLINLFSSEYINSIQINTKCFYVKEILLESYNLLTCFLQLNKNNIKTYLTLSKEMEKLYCCIDYDILLQIIIHLLSNSVKFTQQGFILIKAGVERSSSVPCFSMINIIKLIFKYHS